jgi:battenin
MEPTFEFVQPFGFLVSSLQCSKDPPNCIGLINNVLYVIILSAALDLVGPSVPKGVVLLADVVPSFFTKLTAPYFAHLVPYSARICGLVVISTTGMLLIALTPENHDASTITVKMVGVMLASLSSGAGELSFLGLTHYYGHFSLAAWGSGTGGAGLVGAGAYLLATTTLGLSVRTSLLAFSFLPLILFGSFFIILPRHLLRDSVNRSDRYESVPDDDVQNDVDGSSGHSPSFTRVQSTALKVVLKEHFKRVQKLIVP